MFDEKLMQVANKLVEHCRNHTERQGLDELYAQDAVSVEAADMGEGREVKGVDAIKAKHDWWDNAFEVHSGSVEGPYAHGPNQFGAIFELDATNKETGERSEMKEFGVYTVEGGKITREEFFYRAE
ncbi:MAG: nuclear transport factor 2 family protein [Pseudomonadota bacterium]